MITKYLEQVAALLQTDMTTTVLILAGGAVVLALGVLCWVFGAVGLSAMAKHREVRGRWMGWFPVFNVILVGRLADRYLDDVKRIPSDKRQSLLGLEIAVLLSVCAASFLWLAGSYVPEYAQLITILALAVSACALVVLIAFLVQLYGTCYHIYYSCTPDDAKLLTVLTVLMPVLLPFFLFGLRKKSNGMPPKRKMMAK